jgi:hypothetical protein
VTRGRTKVGSLTVVGTGYNVAGQVTPEARSCIEAAERVFYLLSDSATSGWLKTLNVKAESLHDCYRVGEPGPQACERMVERIVLAVRAGADVCAVFYGHPAVCVAPGIESVRRARTEGFAAQLLPAISFEDCLFADLGVDPGSSGRLMYEATDFLVRPRTFDTTAALILLQAGAIGLVDFTAGDQPNVAGLAVLTEVLLRHYPPTHRVALYRMSQLPIFPPRIDWMALADLPSAGGLSVVSTLFVPPLAQRPFDREVFSRLQQMAANVPNASHP